MDALDSPLRPREISQSQFRRQVATLIILVILLGLLLYLYNLVSKPLSPAEPAVDTGISNVISIYGWGKERLYAPDGVAVDKSGRIYVADTGNHRVAVFNSAGRHLFHFGSTNTPKAERLKRGKLFFPLGIAIGPNGDIYVTSMLKSTLSIFSGRGRFKDEVAMDRPIRPLIVGKRLYVATPGQIWVADLKGKVLERWGKQGRMWRQFNYPNGLGVDKQGNLFVSDSENHRLQILDKRGRLRGIMGRPGRSLGDSNRLFGLAAGLALDDQDRVYVVDALHHAVRVFDHDGNDLGQFGKQGFEDGRFNYPTGIAYLSGRLFAISDKWNDRVQVVRIVPPGSASLVERIRGALLTPAVIGLILLLLLLLVVRWYRARARSQRPAVLRLP